VQAKLDANQQGAARNTRHEYLLRALISCGACRLGCTGRQTAAGYRYYLCRGRTDPLRVAQGQRCTARYIPAGQLDELVWADLCALLTDPAQVTRALARAQGGAWLPQELQARQATIGRALGQLDRQQQRLLDAYLAEVITLPELERKRQDLDRSRDTLLAQQRQLDAAARQRLELGAVADGIEAFCQTVRAGLATATFEQRRLLAELLIDRVVVTDGEVEIRYVLPTSPDGPHRPFCQLRKDHLRRSSRRSPAWSNRPRRYNATARRHSAWADAGSAPAAAWAALRASSKCPSHHSASEASTSDAIRTAGTGSPRWRWATHRAPSG
jgi:site-specific DNA recombinase